MSEAVEPAEASQTKQKDETVVTAEENAPAVPQPAATEDSVMADASVNDAPTTTEQKTGEFEETLAEPIEAATKEEQAVTDNANALETETVSKSDVPTSIPDPASTTADHEAQMAEQVESASEIQVPAPAPPATPAKTTAPASQPMSRTMSTAMGTEAADEATRAPVREYLQERVADWLLHGMKWLATRKYETFLYPIQY
jgi:hypothetical protein